MASRTTNKTQPTDESVGDFVAAIPDERRRAGAHALLRLMTEATGAEPRMWGPSIVGFGRYRYRYATGREGEYCATGFSPRTTSLTVYLMDGFEGREDALERLGPHTPGKSCVYLKRLDDVDTAVLRELVADSYRNVVTSSAEPR